MPTLKKIINNLKINHINELIYKIEIDSQRQKTNFWLQGGEAVGKERDKSGNWN